MQLLKDFPVVFTQQVAWGDMDAFNHVNNVQYYRYFESARIAYFNAINLSFEEDTYTVIASSNCRYLSPVVFPDCLYIGARVEELRNTAMRMSYHMISQQQQKVVATGEAVIVCLDKQSHEKVKLPDNLKEKILVLEKKVGRTL